MNIHAISILMLTISVIAAPAQAEIIRIQETIENGYILVNINKSEGYILASTCKDCKQLRLSVDGSTQAFKDNIPVPLKKLQQQSGKQATVTYDIKTKTAKKVKWYGD